MKIALFQMKMADNTVYNLERCLEAVYAAAAAGADLILFPELTLLPFFPQYPALDVTRHAVPISHSMIRRFQDACKNSRIYAAPNFYLMEQDKHYDASILIDRQGEIVGIQKMVHIAQAEQFYEQDYYTPSNDGFHVFETDFGRIGIVVCFDRHYPESVRTEALRGADLILIPTANTKSEPLELFEWEIRVQAFQNCVPIAMCNRTGREDAMDFAGESLAVDASGNLLMKAGDEEGLYYVEIEMDSAKNTQKARPYTTLRRPSLYE